MSEDTKKIIYSMVGVSKHYNKQPIIKRPGQRGKPGPAIRPQRPAASFSSSLVSCVKVDVLQAR